jgi:diaminohydroxyphosphoribosylaminopyrimidine deaminase/5-amino-6-(5-phosphoribosylamino)uracil reductase
MMTLDEKYMSRCLDLAKQGLGNAQPNPMVGSVIVYNDNIIGEGYHQKCGEAHAEVNAINSVKDRSLLEDSTLYVNLEPCSHFGKTPPCSDLIIKNNIPRVVIGCIDSFSEVAGKGIEKLKNAGCDVAVGVLEKESRDLNRRFFTFHEKKRPYIILKWAQTLDGFIDFKRDANSDDKPMWITNAISKALVHKWRSEEDGIIVGTNTAELDNPALNVREWRGEDPVRMVVDQYLSLSKDLKLFDKSVKTMVFTEETVPSVGSIEYVKVDFNDKLVEEILNHLYKREIQSLIVEGGEQFLTHFIKQGAWDEARVFIGNKIFHDGVKAPNIKGEIISEDTLGDSKLLLYRNYNS